jgi:tellurite resistance protein TerC
VSVVETIFIVIQLIFLEGILSIDNAAVLGAMVSELPADEPIPWPRRLKFMEGHGERILGAQRAAALKVGLLGAYFGRALMLLMASYVIKNLWLRMLGAAYLFKISVAHLGIDPFAKRSADEGDGKGSADRVAGKGFWYTVLLVELVDLAFSIDNVVAAVALSNQIWVVMLGVALGIVTMRFAAQIFTVMIEREPILAPTAYMLVLNISFELLIEEGATALGYHVHFAHWQKFVISVGTIVLALLYANIPIVHRILHPIVYAMRVVFGVVNRIIDLLLWPFTWILKTLFSAISSLFRSSSSSAA